MLSLDYCMLMCMGDTLLMHLRLIGAGKAAPQGIAYPSALCLGSAVSLGLIVQRVLESSPSRGREAFAGPLSSPKAAVCQSRRQSGILILGSLKLVDM